MSKIQKAACLAAACSVFAWAETQPASTVPARIIVTLGHLYGHQPPVLTPDDIVVSQGLDPVPITGLSNLRDRRLELFVLVDNCSSCEPGSRFDELRQFLTAQPPTTTIGVAYIQDGQLRIAEPLSSDRERVTKAINPPSGNPAKNPYRALGDLINGWPADSARHAVVMITNGVDPADSDQLVQDPIAERAIELAQRSRTTVFAIYHPSSDYVTTDTGKIYVGQVRLAHVAIETGGEGYFVSFGPSLSLAPFLADIADHLTNQYLLEFSANPITSAGSLEEITVRCKNSDIELMAPAKVWIPGAERSKGTHRPRTTR